jgi:alkanesulfonate monooxygenase SsuD/methylene tetrahydromethanopterin reductase-like flavin-dependent oxidoreductase (luciferase family)
VNHCIKLGVFMMPIRPAGIAAHVAMLDHMLKGCFIMGISPGGLMSDAEDAAIAKTS